MCNKDENASKIEWNKDPEDVISTWSSEKRAEFNKRASELIVQAEELLRKVGRNE